MASFWNIPLPDDGTRQSNLVPSSLSTRLWQTPFAVDEVSSGAAGDILFNSSGFTSDGHVPLGFDQLAQEEDRWIPFYSPLCPYQPEQDSYHELHNFNWNMKEYSGELRQPQDFQEPPWSWQQNTEGPSIGFESFVLPDCRNNNVAHPLSMYSEATDNYGANRRYSYPTSYTNTTDRNWRNESENRTLDIGFEGSAHLYQPANVETWQDAKQREDLAFHGNSGESYLNILRSVTDGPSRPGSYAMTSTRCETPDWCLGVIEIKPNSDERPTSFCDSVNKWRKRYPASDTKSNSGMVWNVATTFPKQLLSNSVFKGHVLTHATSQPISFTTAATCLVQDFIMDILRRTNEYPPQEEHFLSICGSDEFLQNDHLLGSHESLQKTTSDIFLRLHKKTTLWTCLARTQEDDQKLFCPNALMQYTHIWKVPREKLSAAISKYNCQAGHLLQSMHGMNDLLESIRAICYLLCSVETKAITEALGKLRMALMMNEQRMYQYSGSPMKVSAETAMMDLSSAISHLIFIYCTSFHEDLRPVKLLPNLSYTEAGLESHFSFTLCAVHNTPSDWMKRFTIISVSCSLIYAGKKICQTENKKNEPVKKSFFYFIHWNEKISFPLPSKSLPYETMLLIKFRSTDNTSGGAQTLGWTCLPLYSKQNFVHGTLLLGMAMNSEPPAIITPGVFDPNLPTGVTLQIDFPRTEQAFLQPEPAQNRNYTEAPTVESMKHIAKLSQKHSLSLLPEAEKRFLWVYRSHCSHKNCFLPLVLGSAPSWDPNTVSEMHEVMKDWVFSSPLEALGLLTSGFSDQVVREAAVQQIEKLSNDELLEFLPQLVQALKFEWHLESLLVKLLLMRSQQNIRVMHRLYWLLKAAINEPHFKSWYRKLLAGLQFCAGRALNSELSKETQLVQILENVAVKVRAAHDSKRQGVLKTELSQLERFFQEENTCRLPLDPAVLVQGINREACTYFTSNASPVKVSFVNADPLGKPVNVIFKIGDDLRQDMLVLQIIRVMDKMWLQEGLDLHMIIYSSVCTGKDQGLVHMVPDAITLAKIHRQSGIIGPLKENTILKWFRRHHPSQVSYQKAVNNFFYSCAGWCIVTFILGVCDRHNDNIMLTNTGHMFHIDFGKFLGHAQKLGPIKRDRAPFVFTSEMEYFITEGGKNPGRFQEFVELCCQAYNIIRKHSYLLLNLLELMMQAGLPELRGVQDLRYMHNNLRPQDSDLQAISYFTRKIKESLECVPVKLNNMIHILAQMITSSSTKFASKPESRDVTPITDRSIIRATVLGFSRKQESVYLIEVVKSDRTVILTEKTYSQFLKLHSQLQKQLHVPPLPHHDHFSHIHWDHRRMQDLNLYLEKIFNGSSELAHNEQVLSFFLDEPKRGNPGDQFYMDPGLKFTGKEPGIQLYVSYEKPRLKVLLKHLKNIHLPDGSAPSAHIEICVLPDPDQTSQKKTKMVPKSTDPTFNELVEYDNVISLQGHVLKLIVKSRGTFVGAINIQLGQIQLNEDIWYPLGNCII
ncbi:phosphatidylinositol 3-kinase C2 domain-containing subunit gamma [Microcaecilia unicolor]|uniref:Phosphatidylinositol 4-phosphate 3-kinase C2 domain-containing subunit gamma n=1 Tax=Microcaecilia unicolor TaxID=1415580 RepID=A0A6P7Z1F0_9AMPH|nr:phosphatidylinositol 4-phosphate 3-kinase C2 domain-containing subunit gamma [Microcaecilia unicolor]